MAEQGISMENFRALVARAGMELTEQELETLKPMYEHFARQAASLQEVDLGAEDLALAYSPNWDAN
jgi:hypothetical protein